MKGTTNQEGDTDTPFTITVRSIPLSGKKYDVDFNFDLVFDDVRFFQF